mmetsp:Transcript_58463/g.131488  ORF Transcript_58463/g.131488 Transcript_58463/m.131488 type:complete len:225 (+) Transcript_58463:405-1079(+)
MVRSKDSVKGRSFLGMLAYFSSSLGWKGLSSLISGGGMAKDLRHWVTCSSPNLACVSALFMPCKSPYILSFKRHVLLMGIHNWSISSSARASVLMARFCKDVNATSTVIFASRSKRPAVMASSAPSSVTSTSTQPVNLFSKFHCDWPCLSKTSVYTPSPSANSIARTAEPQREPTAAVPTAAATQNSPAPGRRATRGRGARASSPAVIPAALRAGACRGEGGEH